jgi:hypothetical protein
MTQIPEHTEDYEALRDRMINDGFHRDHAYVQDIDLDVVTTTLCPAPCWKTRQYEAWVRTKEGRVVNYRAVAVCEDGHAQEF